MNLDMRAATNKQHNLLAHTIGNIKYVRVCVCVCERGLCGDRALTLFCFVIDGGRLDNRIVNGGDDGDTNARSRMCGMNSGNSKWNVWLNCGVPSPNTDLQTHIAPTN